MGTFQDDPRVSLKSTGLSFEAAGRQVLATQLIHPLVHLPYKLTIF